jgi:hypothetical protein
MRDARCNVKVSISRAMNKISTLGWWESVKKGLEDDPAVEIDVEN